MACLGSTSRGARFALTVYTWVTDLYRMSSWFTELHGIDDVQAQERVPLPFEVIPIMPGLHSMVNPASVPGTAAPFSMESEARIQMNNVIVLSKAILGSPPNWLRRAMEDGTNPAPRFDVNENGHLVEQDVPAECRRVALLRWALCLENHSRKGVLIYSSPPPDVARCWMGRQNC